MVGRDAGYVVAGGTKCVLGGGARCVVGMGALVLVGGRTRCKVGRGRVRGMWGRKVYGGRKAQGVQRAGALGM